MAQNFLLFSPSSTISPVAYNMMIMPGSNREQTTLLSHMKIWHILCLYLQFSLSTRWVSLIVHASLALLTLSYLWLCLPISLLWFLLLIILDISFWLLLILLTTLIPLFFFFFLLMSETSVEASFHVIRRIYTCVSIDVTEYSAHGPDVQPGLSGFHYLRSGYVGQNNFGYSLPQMERYF